MSIGKTIKFLRMAKDLKQSELAKRLGVTTNYFSLIENCKREPSLALLKQLSNELDIPLSLLFLDTEFDSTNRSQNEQAMFLRIRDLIMQIETLRMQNPSR